MEHPCRVMPVARNDHTCGPLVLSMLLCDDARSDHPRLIRLMCSPSRIVGLCLLLSLRLPHIVLHLTHIRVSTCFLFPSSSEGAQGPEAAAAERVLAELAAGADAGGGPQPLPFDTSEIEGFRYRVEDVLGGVDKAAVRGARAAELKRQMLASTALAAHFEDHPRDLAVLRHAAPVQVRVRACCRPSTERRLLHPSLPRT